MPNVTKAALDKKAKRNEKIVSLYKKGTPGYKIAKIVGLSAPQVYLIIKKAGASKTEPVIKPVVKKSPAKKVLEKKAAAATKATKKTAPKIIAVIKTRGRPKKK